MLGERDLDELWRRMARVYGHRWTTHFGETDDGTWLAGLRGIAPEHLAEGLRRVIARGDPWPPSLPEFRLVCLGIPKRSLAVTRALNGASTPLAERMRQVVGTWDLNHLSEKDLRARLGDAYDTLADEAVAALAPPGEADGRRLGHAR